MATTLDEEDGLDEFEREFYDDGGPTGHGDTCYSDADPGL